MSSGEKSWFLPSGSGSVAYCLSFQNRINSLFPYVDVETVSHCVSCCATELLRGVFCLLVKPYGRESVGQNQAVCLQVSGLSNVVCVEFLVPEYCITQN